MHDKMMGCVHDFSCCYNYILDKGDFRSNGFILAADTAHRGGEGTAVGTGGGLVCSKETETGMLALSSLLLMQPKTLAPSFHI